jgi:hypothetical protein
MTIEVFKIDLQVQQPDKSFKDLLGQPWGMDLLPRVGDTLDVDSGQFSVVAVQYTYKDQVNPIVFLKHVGDFPEFVQGLSDV